MPEARVKEIADAADMIVNGYAYVRMGDNVRVLNLRTGKATLFGANHSVFETSMDDVDLAVALRYLVENEKFMG